MTTTEMVKLYGAAWSVYVRIARLALEEKQIKYSLVEVDVFAELVFHRSTCSVTRSVAFRPSSMTISIFTRRARSFAIATTLFPDARCSRQVRKLAPR